VRGVPIDANGEFFEPLWTDFRVGSDTGILDWYTILIATTAVLALAHHGALWLSEFTDGAVQRRSSRAASALWIAVVISYALSAWASAALQPQITSNASDHPWGVIFPMVAAGALACTFALRRRGRALYALVASGVSLYAVLASAAFGLHPYLLPARNPAHGLTTSAAAAPQSGLQVTLYWWIPGMLLVAAYFVFVYVHMPRIASIADDHDRV
jgi:cytochrome d ubiquinol oxidase subunit II